MVESRYFLNTVNAGIDHNRIDNIHAINEPIIIPKVGIDHITIKA